MLSQTLLQCISLAANSTSMIPFIAVHDFPVLSQTICSVEALVTLLTPIDGTFGMRIDVFLQIVCIGVHFVAVSARELNSAFLVGFHVSRHVVLADHFTTLSACDDQELPLDSLWFARLFMHRIRRIKIGTYYFQFDIVHIFEYFILASGFILTNVIRYSGGNLKLAAKQYIIFLAKASKSTKVVQSLST